MAKRKRPFGIKTETDVLHDVMFKERIRKSPSASKGLDRLLATIKRQNESRGGK